MKPNVLNKIISYLDDRYPNAGCELLYQKDYELLIAVVLSAQTTDKAVNLVTPKLFKQFSTLQALAAAPIASIAHMIRSIGLYQTKAKHIQGIAKDLLHRFNGKVPEDKAALLSLPGVGIKTANVVRAELFHIPEIAVDTHVHRLAFRLGFSTKKDHVSLTEKKLRKILPEARYIKTHHQLIHFGRYACKAKKPLCGQCGLVTICQEPHKNLS